MAGILDNKSRVMDVIITPLGRSQMASGKMRIEYASFADKSIVYTSSSSGALENLANRVYFEAASSEYDQIIYEIDSDGDLAPFRSGEYQINSQDVTYVSSSSGTAMQFTGSIDLIAEEVCANALKHFQSQQIIGTRDLFREDHGSLFSISHTTASFRATNTFPLNVYEEITDVYVDDIPTVFQSSTFGHLPNFQYLPPITKPWQDHPTGSELGNYSRINKPAATEWSTMESYLSKFDKQRVEFTETSQENNLICQLFEERFVNTTAESNCTLEKLAIIDYGTFSIDTDSNAHIFFAGKIFRDSAGCLCFANLLTLVFNDEEE